MNFADFLSGLGGIMVASGVGTAGVALLGQLLKYLLGLLQAKAAKTASPVDDLALKGVEVAVDTSIAAAQKALGKK